VEGILFMKFYVGTLLVISMAVLGIGCQGSVDSSSSYNSPTTNSAGAGPIGDALTGYHLLYSEITSSSVKATKAYIRTDDGQTIRVPFEPTVLNLMDLLGATKGVVLHLKNLGLPASVTQLSVVEIELHLTGGEENDVTFSDATSCDLKAKKELVLFTRRPFVVELNADYLVKVKFDSLKSIQLSCNGKTEGNNYSINHFDQHNYQHYDQHNDRNHDDSNDHDHKKCDNDDDIKECRLNCRLASQREEIVNIINANDEF
jgi:hypothetical protein